MNVKWVLKGIVLKCMPEKVRKHLLKVYYLRALKSYLKNRLWESYENDMAIVKGIVTRGDSVIDIGANFGVYSALLSKLTGEDGEVFSFEPIPLTYEILLNNVQKLSLVNVKTFEYAISEKDGSGVMVIPKWSVSGNENFYQASLRSQSTIEETLREVQVGLRKLDSLFRGHLKRIAFIKIDVEGHELQVIEGAKLLISQSRPVLLIEVSGSPDNVGCSAFTLFEQLKKEGYSAYWYDGVTLKRRSPHDNSINYFFFTTDQLADFMAVNKGAIPINNSCL